MEFNLAILWFCFFSVSGISLVLIVYNFYLERRILRGNAKDESELTDVSQNNGET